MTRRRRCHPDFSVSIESGEARRTRSVKKKKKEKILESFFSFSNSRLIDRGQNDSKKFGGRKMMDFFSQRGGRTRRKRLKAVVEMGRKRGGGREESWRGQLDESRVCCGGRKVSG